MDKKSSKNKSAKSAKTSAKTSASSKPNTAASAASKPTASASASASTPASKSASMPASNSASKSNAPTSKSASKSNAPKSTASVSALAKPKIELEQFRAFLNSAKDDEVEQLRSLLGDKLEPKSKSTDKNFQDEALSNTRKAPNADKKKRKFEDDPINFERALKTLRGIAEKDANNILISDDDNEQSDEELEEQEEESDDQPEEPDNQPEEPDDEPEEPDDEPEEPDDQPEEPDDQPPVEPKKKRRKGNDGHLRVTGDAIELISQAVANRMEEPRRRKGYILCY
jgi:hypothetical protein